jgi:hypothetical protein
MEKSEQLMELTRRALDLKAEKKKFNAEINDQIKETETEIKKLVKE